jgi:outer membrane lipoprotein-sorting protein
MHPGIKLAIAASIALFFMPAPAARAAQKDLKEVLSQLDAAAANFRSTSADFEFDTIQTDPIYDKDVQKGIVYYKRNGKAFQMGAHIREENGKPVPKDVVLKDGLVQLYEKLTDQLTTLSKLGQYQSWFMLGFGASGKELEEKWEIRYIGPAMIDGVNTAELEMTPKDPAVRKNLPKVTVWMDTARGVSLKQVYDEGQGQSRTCLYTNIKVNQSLPGDAFTFKTDSKTQLITR